MSCCDQIECRQGRDCPRRRAVNLAEAVAGYGAVLCICLAAAIWLVVLAE